MLFRCFHYFKRYTILIFLFLTKHFGGYTSFEIGFFRKRLYLFSCWVYWFFSSWPPGFPVDITMTSPPLEYLKIFHLVVLTSPGNPLFFFIIIYIFLSFILIPLFLCHNHSVSQRANHFTYRRDSTKVWR